MTFTYRPAEPADGQMILSGWSSSYRLSRDVAFIQMDRYAETMHAIVRSVLARPRVQTIVADGDISARVGFICFEHSQIGGPPLVMYIFFNRQIVAGMTAGAVQHRSIAPSKRVTPRPASPTPPRSKRLRRGSTGAGP